MALTLTLTASLCRLQNEHFSSIDQSVSSSGSQSLKEGKYSLKLLGLLHMYPGTIPQIRRPLVIPG